MNVKKLLLVALCATPLFASADPAAFDPAQANRPSHADIAYARDNNKAHTLDIYLPQKRAADMPLVVYVHGGGWKVGDKNFAAFNAKTGVHRLIKALLDEGYAVASLNYRLSGEARFPAQSDDVAQALNYLTRNAAKYGYNAKRIALAGDSAGGHLAQLAALAQGRSKIRALVSFYGVSDLRNVKFERLAKNCAAALKEQEAAANGPSENTREGLLVGEMVDSAAFNRAADAASPIQRVSAKMPPALFFHGDNDCSVPHTQSLKMHAALKSLNVPSELVIAKGLDHMAPEFHNEEYNRRVLDFLKRHL